MMILKRGMSLLLGVGIIFGQDSVSLVGHRRDVNVVACSMDGRMIASGAEDERQSFGTWRPTKRSHPLAAAAP